MWPEYGLFKSAFSKVGWSLRRLTGVWEENIRTSNSVIFNFEFKNLYFIVHNILNSTCLFKCKYTYI